ncbi:MAG: hypothetical protein HY244_02475 [Rhizobiales bacterium]|nr:hypothetical protein [Hyphomicrobiales bacterium]
MRASVRTTIIRDLAGYEVRDYGNPAPVPGASLLAGPPSGIHIVGKSGTNETVTISTAQNLRRWEKVRRINSPEEIVEFMNAWGQISRWLGDDGSKPYSEAYILIEPHLQSIKQLASYVEGGDKRNFYLSLTGNRLLDRAIIAVDVNEPDSAFIVEAPSLLRFMIVEMWNEFGGERPADFGFRICPHCGTQFQVGGRRDTKTRRTDARFCSDSCRSMASRARVKLQGKAAFTPPR